MFKNMLSETLRSSQPSYQIQNFNLKEFRESVRKEFIEQNSHKVTVKSPTMQR